MRISKLRSVFDHGGPFATAYLAATNPDTAIIENLRQRWHALCEDLTDQGCDRNTLQAMGSTVLDARAGERAEGVLTIGTGGDCVFYDSLPGGSIRNYGRLSALPAFGPYVRAYGNPGLMTVTLPPGGRDGLESALTAAGVEFESANRDRLLDEFTSNLASGRAVQGGGAVVDAVRRGAVEVLLLSRPAGIEIPVGPEPLQLGWYDDDLNGLVQKGDRVEQDLLESAVIRAGAATDLHTEALADAELEDGVGALLRFEDGLKEG